MPRFGDDGGKLHGSSSFIAIVALAAMLVTQTVADIGGFYRIRGNPLIATPIGIDMDRDQPTLIIAHGTLSVPGGSAAADGDIVASAFLSQSTSALQTWISGRNSHNVLLYVWPAALINAFDPSVDPDRASAAAELQLWTQERELFANRYNRLFAGANRPPIAVRVIGVGLGAQLVVAGAAFAVSRYGNANPARIDWVDPQMSMFSETRGLAAETLALVKRLDHAPSQTQRPAYGPVVDAIDGALQDMDASVTWFQSDLMSLPLAPPLLWPWSQRPHWNPLDYQAWVYPLRKTLAKRLQIVQWSADYTLVFGLPPDFVDARIPPGEPTAKTSAKPSAKARSVRSAHALERYLESIDLRDNPHVAGAFLPRNCTKCAFYQTRGASTRTQDDDVYRLHAWGSDKR